MIKVAFFCAMHIRTSCVLIKVAFVLSCNICLIIRPNEFLLLCVIKKIVCLGEITFCLAHAHKNFKVLLIMLPFCWHEQEFCVHRSFFIFYQHAQEQHTLSILLFVFVGASKNFMCVNPSDVLLARTVTSYIDDPTTFLLAQLRTLCASILCCLKL